MEKSDLSLRERDSRRRGEIIQPEFSGLRAIPLDSFDVVSSALACAPPSFLPYFIPSSVRVAARCKFAPIAAKPVGNIKPVSRHNQNYISFRASPLASYISRKTRIFLSLKKKTVVFNQYLTRRDYNMIRNLIAEKPTYII